MNRDRIVSIPINKKNDLVLGIVYRLLKNSEFDCNDTDFRKILNELIEEYKALKQKIFNTKSNIPPEFTKLVIGANITLTNILQELNSNYPSEINMSRYIVDLLNYTNTITKYFQKSIQHQEATSQEHQITFLERIRNWNPLRKWMLGLGLFSGLIGGGTVAGRVLQKDNISTKNTIEIKKDDKLAIPEKTKILTAKELNVAVAPTPENKVKDIDIAIVAPPGYEYMFEEKAIVTAYTPTGEGLMPGVNPDGTPYKETKRTSTNLNATRNFDGVAVDPSVIPYGSLIYIKGVGWKIADDTGAKMRENWNNYHRVHIDLRVPVITQNILNKTGEINIVVFKNISGKDYYHRVKDARKAFKNPDSNIFKHIKSNP